MRQARLASGLAATALIGGAAVVAIMGGPGAAYRGLRERASATVHEVVWSTKVFVDRLTIEGRPAPALDGVSLDTWRGRPVLLFFWAHWCGGCRNEVPIIAAVQSAFAPHGLSVVGLTQLYGYAEGGRPVPPEAELEYIGEVQRRYYAPLGDIPMAISSANWEAYRAGATPTIVLIDKGGIVRFYHPGFVDETELTSRVAALL